MFGQLKSQIGPTDWSKLVGSLVPCLTFNHTKYNLKTQCGNYHAWEGS
jgi:hypothetical protein